MRTVYSELGRLLCTEGLPCLSLDGLATMLGGLSAQRLILAEHLRKGLDTKIWLNVSVDDVDFALKNVEEE